MVYGITAGLTFARLYSRKKRRKSLTTYAWKNRMIVFNADVILGREFKYSLYNSDIIKPMVSCGARRVLQFINLQQNGISFKMYVLVNTNGIKHNNQR